MGSSPPPPSWPDSHYECEAPEGNYQTSLAQICVQRQWDAWFEGILADWHKALRQTRTNG